MCRAAAMSLLFIANPLEYLLLVAYRRPHKKKDLRKLPKVL